MDEGEKLVEGKYYFGKGYWWKGEFLETNYGQDAYELGYSHGKQIAQRHSDKELKKIYGRVRRYRTIDDYEEGKKQAIIAEYHARQ